MKDKRIDEIAWEDYQAYQATWKAELETARLRAASEAQARSWAMAAAEKALRKTKREQQK